MADQSQSNESYFRISAESYNNVIEELLSETAAQSSERPEPELVLARRHYFETALAKGADLSTINIASLSSSELTEAAQEIPDKQAIGWNGSTSLSDDDRKSFLAAADKRSAAMRWDNLFPAGTDNILVTFSGSPQSSVDKVERYIQEHNQRAIENLAIAREWDATEQRNNPAARPTAGKTIDQRQIRISDRAKENAIRVIEGKKPLPSVFQTLNPNKQGKNGEELWEDGPTVGKFLQDNFEWELFDHVQRGTGSGNLVNGLPYENSNSSRAKLKDLANHSPQNADELFAAGKLRVLISRDPQKIGEMSTGQRWRSCMASDGINYHFVPKDIEAGSLVAYVVHEDDADARYPLMRQLIKPFRNNAGDTILVPAKVYGGDGAGNSLTRDALQSTLNNFAAAQNAGKSGEFLMDSTLYADGQAVMARLQGSWTPENIAEALHGYINGSVQEWMTEIKINSELAAQGQLGNHETDPMSNIKNLKNKIRRAFNPQDAETGLPRMFYREMLSTSIGSIPHPRDIYAVASSDVALNAEGNAFKALMNQDMPQWKLWASQLSPDIQIQTATAAAAMQEAGSPQEGLAATAWEKALDAASPDSDQRFVEALQVVHTTVEDSTLHERAGIIALDAIANSPPEEKITNTYRIIVSTSKGSALRERASSVALDSIPKLDPHERSNEALRVMLYSAKGSTVSIRAGTMALDNLAEVSKWLPNNIATQVMTYSTPGSELHERAGTLALDGVAELSSEAGYKQAKDVMTASVVGTPLYERASKIRMEVLPDLSPIKRFEAATEYMAYNRWGDNPTLFEQFGTVALDAIPQLRAEERVGAAHKLFRLSYSAKDGSPLYEQAGNAVLDIIEKMPGNERIDNINNLRFEKGSALYTRANEITLDNITELPAHERFQVAMNIRYYSVSLRERATSIALENISELPADKRLDAAEQIMFHSKDDPINRERSGNIVLDNILQQSSNQRVRVAASVISYSAELPVLHERAGRIALDALAELPSEERHREIRDLLWHIKKNSPLYEQIGEAYIKTISELPQNRRFDAARSAMINLEVSSPNYETAGMIALDHIDSVPKGERSYTIKNIIRRSPQISTLRDKGRTLLREYQPLSSFFSDLVRRTPSLSSGNTSIIPTTGKYAALLGHVGHGASAAGVALGAYGAVNSLKSGQFNRDMQGDEVQKAAAVTSLTANAANAAGGIVTTGSEVLTKYAPKTAEAFGGIEGGLGAASKIAGRAAVPLAVVAGAADAAVGWQQHDPARVAGAVGGTFGGILGGILVGAAAGAATSATLGATAGSVVPGLGTVTVGAVAGIIGGIVGGVAGGIVGEQVAKKYATDAARWSMDAVQNIQNIFQQQPKHELSPPVKQAPSAISRPPLHASVSHQTSDIDSHRLEVNRTSNGPSLETAHQHALISPSAPSSSEQPRRQNLTRPQNTVMASYKMNGHGRQSQGQPHFS